MSEAVLTRLTAVGIPAPELVSASPASKTFGSAHVIFRVGNLLLRVVRDRGQEFLDVGASAPPEHFYQFDDLEIAMGWKTLDELLSRQELEDLERLLPRVSNHMDELQEVFSQDRRQFTEARLDKAARDRGEATMRNLRGDT
jgi:hypothetical protein